MVYCYNAALLANSEKNKKNIENRAIQFVQDFGVAAVGECVDESCNIIQVDPFAECSHRKTTRLIIFLTDGL